MTENTPYLKMFGFSLYGLLSSIYVNPEALMTLTLLMCIDTVFGVLKAHSLQYDLSFRSLFSGFFGKLVLLLIPVTLSLGLKNLEIDGVFLVLWSIKILTAAELISMTANLIAIRTREPVKNFDIITLALKHLREKFINIARGLTDLDNYEDKK